jgi:predicted 3-demethylubiquinone-9 3-methyltransferase (glyoxalase superfamily)
LTSLKNRDSVKQQTLQGGNILKHVRIHGSKHDDMENELLEWFCHAQANSVAVDDQTVKARADEIALKMGTDFKCSNGWLQSKDRWKITWQPVSSEGAPADTDSAEKWK